jgi:50S ribosomal subunit-associated GTPase HflX
VSVKRAAADPIIVVVGNKCDLAYEDAAVARMREIAEQYSAEYIMTSAKTGQNIDILFNHVFLALVKLCQASMEVLVSEPEGAAPPQTCC